jgi:protein-export membrane protein SecD
MLYFARWKIYAIIASVIAAILLCLPNFASEETQDWLKANTIARPMTLGLDLQGGSNIMLEVDRADMREQLLKQLPSEIRRTLTAVKVQSRSSRAGDTVTVRLNNPADKDTARTALQDFNPDISLGALSGGTTVKLYDIAERDDGFTLRIADAGLEANVSRAVDQSLRIIESRVNALGTTEPTIQRQGADRIVVQLPGIQNPDEVKNVLGQTAVLTFQLLCDTQPINQNDRPPPDCEAFPLKEDPNQNIWVQTSSSATVRGGDLTDAQPAFDQNNQPVVTFRFNQRGALQFGKLTADNVGKPFAIVLDQVVQSYPRINEPILGGTGQISGNFSVEETNALAVVLRSGALPAKLNIIQETTVGPSLGSDSVEAGVLASIVGLIGVMIFMVIAYGIFGIFANIALLVNLLLLVAIMSVFGFTLTLPGIAGIVLTMGMAVDSNVLVYERIREEWRNGRTALSAIETGFKEALATVIDANVTTLIAAIVLFGVGSGPVRGFAVTLAIGIFTTMYTAFTVTRLIMSFWVKQTRPKEVPL